MQRQLGERRSRPQASAALTKNEISIVGHFMNLSPEGYLDSKDAERQRAAAHAAGARPTLMVPSLPYASRAVAALMVAKPNADHGADDLRAMSVDELCDRACEHLASREDPAEPDPAQRLARASACLMEALNRQVGRTIQTRAVILKPATGKRRSVRKLSYAGTRGSSSPCLGGVVKC